MADHCVNFVTLFVAMGLLGYGHATSLQCSKYTVVANYSCSYDQRWI